MSFDNVLRRYCDPNDFYNSYKSLCCIQDSIPINILKSHLKNGTLELNGDKVRVFDWPPIINAIKFDRSLTALSIFSIYRHNLKTRRKTLRFKMNCPSVHTREVIRRLAIAISTCLKASKKLQVLELQGLPFTEKDLLVIAKGVGKNQSIKHLAIDYCPISERGVKAICEGLRLNPTVMSISMNGCNLSSSGVGELAKLLHHQSLTNHTQRWAESLRYRTPDLRQMCGIRRLSLNSNPLIGDKGVAPFCEIFPQDLWIKAVDLQDCGLTDAGADVLFKSIESNQTLVVLDIRNNRAVSERKLRDILASVLLNAQSHDEKAYPWVKHNYPKLSHATNVRRKPNISKVMSTYMPPAKSADKPKVKFEDDKKKLASVSAVSSSTSQIRKRPSTAPAPSPCRNNACKRYTGALERQVTDLKAKLALANDLEKALKDMVIGLESENFELKQQLNEKTVNGSVFSDETVLENVEQSFNKFHEFLDKLHEAGLGSFISQSGLGKAPKFEDMQEGGCLKDISAIACSDDGAGGDLGGQTDQEIVKDKSVIDAGDNNAAAEEKKESPAPPSMEEKQSAPLSTQEEKVDEVIPEESAAPAVSTKSSTKSEKSKPSNDTLSSAVSSSSSSGSEYSDSFTQNSLTTTATPSVSASKP